MRIQSRENFISGKDFKLREQQNGIGASLAIGVVVTVFAKVDTDDHCKYIQIKQI